MPPTWNCPPKTWILGSTAFLGFFTVRFNNKKHDAFLTVLKKNGAHLRKANFDVEIAVEAMKRIGKFDVFMLFSGDSDFDYLIKELKRNGKKTIVASLKHHISKELIESADYYLNLKKIKNEIQRRE